MSKRVILGRPYTSTRKDKKLMVFVKNPQTKRIIKIHFGERGCRHNYSKKAWLSYMARSKSITNGKGRRTYKNRLSANYWSRKFLWGGKKWKRSYMF